MSHLVLRGVTVTYGRAAVVHDLAFDVPPGDWLCLIGPNGAGKSSLLHAVAGLVRHQGQIVLDGTDLRSLGHRARARRVAFVPQSPLMPDDMTGLDYVLLGRTPYVRYFGMESRRDREIAGAVLDRLDLAGFASRRLGALSGGERQRLVIARALAQDAPVLLLDEPTSSLDIGHQQQALELVDRLRQETGLTVLSAMHDLTLAGLYSDRLALLHAGHLVVTGPAAEVLRPDVLAEFYNVSVTVHHQPDGTVVVVPRRRSAV